MGSPGRCTQPPPALAFPPSCHPASARSTACEWLVVAGARAQYKGTGTINGSGSYSFILTVIDGKASGGGGEDRFRPKVWGPGGVICDNQMG